LAGSGWFVDVVQHVFPFSVAYSSEQFSALLDTYASHQVLDEPTRLELHRRLTELIEAELGGSVTKPYEAVLVLGRRGLG